MGVLNKEPLHESNSALPAIEIIIAVTPWRFPARALG